MPRHPISRPRGSSRLAFMLGLLGCAGCGTEPEPEPTGVDVTGPAQRVVIGTAFKLDAAVQGAAGPITGAKITWVSRDSTTVTVRPDGSATAVAAGEAWVVGTAGTVSDSALVEVTFLVSDQEGRTRLRVDGRETTVSMRAVGAQIDLLGTPDESIWLVLGGNPVLDTLIAAYFLTAPTGQRTALVEVAPNDTQGPAGNAPFAFLDMEDAVTYKFINKVLTKTELDDLFKYRIK